MFTLKIWLHRYWTSWSSWFGKLYEGRSCELVQVVLWTSPGCRVFREHLVFIFTFLINWKPGLFSYGNLIKDVICRRLLKWHHSVSICVLMLWGLISQKWEGMSCPNFWLTWWTLQLNFAEFLEIIIPFSSFPSLVIRSSRTLLFIFLVFLNKNKLIFWPFQNNAKNRWHCPLKNIYVIFFHCILPDVQFAFQNWSTVKVCIEN